MPSAREQLDSATGGFAFNPSRVTREELRALDVALPDVLLDGRPLDVDVADAVIDASVELTIEGASVVEISIHDPGHVLLASGIFSRAVDLTLDERNFRLVKVAKSGSDLNLTFEDLIVAYMRQHNKYRKASRGKVTRAEFALSLVREVKKVRIKFFSPELHKRQPIKKKDSRGAAERASRRAPGFGGGAQIEVKGVEATTTQKKNIERVLDVGQSKRANRTVQVSAVCTITEESNAYNLVGGDRDSVGLFQQRKSQGWPATRNIETDATAYYDKAISLNKSNPDWPAWRLAHEVQRNFDTATKGARTYKRWYAEARATVDAYQGKGSGSGGSRTIRKAYEFKRGTPDKKVNTWDALGELADEVKWRRFIVGGDTVFFISDDTLFEAKPAMTISEGDEWVDSLDFDWDTGKKLGECEITGRAERWFAAPGMTVYVKDAGPATGKWLVASIRRSLFDPTSQIRLIKPTEPLPEPDTTTMSVQSEGGEPTRASGGVYRGGNARSRIVAVAKDLYDAREKYTYRQYRPMPRSAFSKEAYDKLDCSSFVTLVYKAARVDDPNGLNYNGSGYTGTLWSNGRPTYKPLPGDLVFYGNPSSTAAHVAIYIGDGECIGFGSTPIRRHKVHYRSDFAGYRTYLKGKDTAPPTRPNAAGRRAGGPAGA